jgi:hypothetical protein
MHSSQLIGHAAQRGPGTELPESAARTRIPEESPSLGPEWVLIETGDVGSGGERAGRDEFSYPSILQVSGGKILIAYTYGREALKTAEFSEDWIEHGHSDGKYNP